MLIVHARSTTEVVIFFIASVFKRVHVESVHVGVSGPSSGVSSCRAGCRLDRVQVL